MQQWMSEKQAVDSSLSSVSSQEEQDQAELSRLRQLLASESQQEKTLSQKIMVRVVDDEPLRGWVYVHKVGVEISVTFMLASYPFETFNFA